MESESKIRRLHFVQGYSIKSLVRKTGLSRNTIRRVLRADKAGRSYTPRGMELRGVNNCAYIVVE